MGLAVRRTGGDRASETIWPRFTSAKLADDFTIDARRITGILGEGLKAISKAGPWLPWRLP
jgi:hypothetical protein